MTDDHNPEDDDLGPPDPDDLSAEEVRELLNESLVTPENYQIECSDDRVAKWETGDLYVEQGRWLHHLELAFREGWREIDADPDTPEYRQQTFNRLERCRTVAEALMHLHADIPYPNSSDTHDQYREVQAQLTELYRALGEEIEDANNHPDIDDN